VSDPLLDEQPMGPLDPSNIRMGIAFYFPRYASTPGGQLCIVEALARIARGGKNPYRNARSGVGGARKLRAKWGR
jgi:hypothetical protein